MYLWDITLLAIYIIFLGVVPKCVTVALHMCGQFSLDINSDEITMNIWIKRGGAPGRVLRVSFLKILYLDDTHVTDEGEEVEEGWLDAVVEVAAASRLAAGRATALEGLVWLVEAKEESVVHIILRHATSASQSAGYGRGQVTIIQPGEIHVYNLQQ